MRYSNTYPFAARLRHQYDRGPPLHRWIMGIMRELQSPKAWKRHPAPFAKTGKGKARRQARRFAEAQRARWLAE